jgi:GT2 family glycosyltransferase
VRVGLVTVAFNSGPGVEALVASARDTRHRLAVELFLHSAHPPTVAACRRLDVDRDVALHPYGTNRGLSLSWNEGLLALYGAAADVVVVANDDVRFGPGDLDTLAATAVAERQAHVVVVAGPHLGWSTRVPSHGYACFALNPVALERIGCFDENLFPAYCEDQDYSRRARLAGLSEAACPGTQVSHEGSATLRGDPLLAAANAVTHGRNLEYYRRKWGGEGDAERFPTPFDDPAVGLRIAPEDRHAPYSRHDRTDLRPPPRPPAGCG